VLGRTMCSGHRGGEGPGRPSQAPADTSQKPCVELERRQDMRGMAKDTAAAPFGRLHFVYTPSRDVPGDKDFFTDALGARLVFAIDEGGT
jgi:hypothetical protein